MMIKTLTLLMVTFLYLLITVVERPVIFLHGLGSSCGDYKSLLAMHVRIQCFDINSRIWSLKTIKSQSIGFCKEIKKKIDNAKKKEFKDYDNGFYLIGASQGGIIARGILHFCSDIREYVKGMVTIGTPNMGLDQIPEQLNKKEDDVWYLKFVKWIARGRVRSVLNESNDSATFGPYEYINTYRNVGKYVDTKEETITDINYDIYEKGYTNNTPVSLGGFIRNVNTKQIYVKRPGKIINEFIEDDNKENRYINLDVNLHVMFDKDTMILPINSQVFGANLKTTSSDNKIFSFEESISYRKNYFQFKTLYDEGKLGFCRKHGDHLNINDEEIYNFIKMLSIDKCNINLMNRKFDPDLFYKICIDYNL